MQFIIIHECWVWIVRSLYSVYLYLSDKHPLLVDRGMSAIGNYK